MAFFALAAMCYAIAQSSEGANIGAGLAFYAFLVLGVIALTAAAVSTVMQRRNGRGPR